MKTEQISKWGGWITSVVIGAAAVITFIYTKGADSQKYEGRTFDSPEQKVEVVKHVENGPTPEQRQRAYILDSINKINAIKSRARRDSLLAAEVKARKDADSINQLNADQLYQTKQELKEIKELLRRNN
jgi:hypothetical protein